MIPETPATKALVAALCAYETTAIATGRIPTLTTLNRRTHGAVGAVILAGLAVHFYAPLGTIHRTTGEPR